MRYSAIFLYLVTLFLISGCSKDDEPAPQTGKEFIIADHTSIKLTSIPSQWISEAKQKLHIAYSHTSHGSQIIDGMSGLVSFKGVSFSWSESNSNDALHLDDYAMSGDLGNPDRTTWASMTRTYLSSHPETSVVMWAWCGQVSSATESDINTYLQLMDGLEKDFPDVTFVYMTGHLDGTGLSGNLHLRNEQIRNYCQNNKKVLYDFADIESYNPDGVYFGNKIPNDECAYDTNGDGVRDGNWAIEWQNSHTLGTDWYNCNSAHSQPLNANMKAFAAWWLWARLAGWNGN